MTFKQNLLEWVKDLGLAVLIAIIVLQFIQPTIVKGGSMEDNFHNNDYLFMSKKAYKWFGEPETGDVVVIHSDLTTNSGAEKKLIKRVIACPGDTLRITGGKVYVNGELLVEDYTKGETYFDMDEEVVPDNCIFVMGDNRENSLDSRALGYFTIDDVIGRVIFRLYPFSKAEVYKR